MKTSYFLAAFLLLSQSLNVYAFSSPSTVPAFLWFPHHNQLQSGNVLNYQTISPKDLAKSVFSQGGWSDVLCSRKQSPQSVDVALVFVGRNLESSHVAGNNPADSALVDLLKISVTRSNFSMAFPYVAASGEETMESILASEIMEACGDDLRINNVAFSESCAVEGGNFQKLADLQSVQDYLLSRAEKKTEGKVDLVVFCYDGTESMNQVGEPRPESEVISGLINSVEQSGAEYTVLYVSDPVRSIKYATYRELERFLAEGAVGNGSANSTGCNEVCKFKSSLLEGILVAIVLLLILISGLCCMMGIDTPTRFESPHES